MINVIAELERIGWGFNWAGDDEIRCLCPFHNDSSPSCAINVKKEKFRCCTAGCGAKGDIITFLAGALKADRLTVKKELSTRYQLSSDRPINVDTIERYHEHIWDAKPLLAELYKRGLTDYDIKKWRLGTKDGRVTIPIKNEQGLYVNIRLYLPGAPGADKFRNLRGRGKLRLYPLEQLEFKNILLCGGEIKAIAAAARLNKHGIGCISSTTGESNWDPRLTHHFKDKNVTVCFDIDEEGIKSQENTCKHLLQVTKPKTLKLNLDPVAHPKGDINDFIVSGGDMLAAYKSAVDFEYTPKKDFSKEKPKRVHLSEAINAKSAGKRIIFTSTVSTLDTSPYVIPSSVVVKCPRDTEHCALCAIFLQDPDTAHQIHPESNTILDMVSRCLLYTSDAADE